MGYKSNKKQVLSALSQAENRTLRGIGEYVEGQAKLMAPVDTGNLRGLISFQTKENSVHVGTNVEYAIHQEKGTSRSPAQPYLTPAVERNKNQITKLAERLMRLD